MVILFASNSGISHLLNGGKIDCLPDPVLGFEGLTQ
jgi:hypothetical protein